MPLRTYPCPVCKKEAIFEPSNLFRPFCSERCKLIDLGEWANETYKVAAEPLTDDMITSDSTDADNQ